jgi:C-methyltransferase C-terminal domain/Methyltransferase domain
MKVSIVMAYYNRRKLLINTLKTIEYYNKDRDIEVIVVDDCSAKHEHITDVPDQFKIPVIIIPVTCQEKVWTCDVIPFNIGFSFAIGDIIIIQNPENLHVGDIVKYATDNLRENIFLSFALYSMNAADSNRLISNTIDRKIYAGEYIKKSVGKFEGRKDIWQDGDTCWYNHSTHRPTGSHLMSAILRKDLEDLNGFDERYGTGFAYSDTEFNARIKRKGMNIRIIDNPFAIHQRHDLAKYKENDKAFRRNMKLFTEVTAREKIYRAPQNSFYNPHKIKNIVNHNELLIKCPITGDEDSLEILNLGEVPLVNHLCNSRSESLSVKKFSLALQMFTLSRLTCLTEIVNKEDLFSDYVYHSGVSEPYLVHCREMYRYLSSFITLKAGERVYDIGGNDGSLLKEFKKLCPAGLVYVNIDASNTFEDTNKKAGIHYINKFFGEEFNLKGKHANLIISTNVFQHTAPIRSFVKGIHKNLAEDGLWCLEFPYLLTTIFNDNYDQVYHEHVYYFILSNIIDLLRQEGMRVFHVSFHNIHAGTLRVLSVKDTSNIPTDHSVQSFLNLESSITPEYMVEWGNRIKAKIKHFKNFIVSLKNDNKNVIAFGAAAKGCVFLNSIGVDFTHIPVIIDDTPEKQGRYMPGTGILITDKSALKTMKVDYILILAHNFSEYIIDSLKAEYSGKFIIMFPEIKII